MDPTFPSKAAKMQSHNTPMEAQGGKGCIDPTRSRPRHWMGMSDQRHAPAAFLSRGKDPDTHWTRSWVGPREGLDTDVRRKILLPLPEIEPRSPGRQSVVRHYTDLATPASHFP
jgi:hypothetical protein